MAAKRPAVSGVSAWVMSKPYLILPGTGRGTATRSGVVEGARARRTRRMTVRNRVRAPSTMLRMVPLPVPGRKSECQDVDEHQVAQQQRNRGADLRLHHRVAVLEVEQSGGDDVEVGGHR